MMRWSITDIPDDVQPCSAWTESMLEMAEWIGAAPTLRLIAAFGGGDFYVPTPMPDNHPIVDAIGLDAARRLAAVYGRERLDLPTGNPALKAAHRQLMIAKVEAGEISQRKAARALGTSTRYLRQLMAKPRIMRTMTLAKPRERQLDLIGWLETESPQP